LAKSKEPPSVLWDTFKLSELRLDQKNYRTGDVGTQRDAIAEMVSDQKQKLVNLARDLMQVGASPGEPIWVTKDTHGSGQYTVLEGNRRVTALKLMENPRLAEGTPVEKHFQNLGKLFEKNPIRELEAKVFANREAAQPWIRRRHLSEASGVGLQGWKPKAKGRADAAQGKTAPRFFLVIELLNDNSDAWNTIHDALENRWTTVDRVLGAKAMNAALGISFDLQKKSVKFENGNNLLGKALLWRILQRMASPDFKFAEIEKKEDRERFLTQFADGTVKLKRAPAAPKSAPKAPKKAARSTRKTKTTAPADVPIVTLAPKSGSRVFRVDGVRLGSLYQECQSCVLEKNKNAAALLLRVFIELSSEALLAKRQIPIPKGKQQTKWSDYGLRLDLKIKTVVYYFDPQGTDSDYKQIRVALDPASANAAFSLPTLHSYFHNLSFIPDPAALRSAWDAWEGFLRAVHDDLRKP
jgi:hypothetical protein